MTKLTKDKKIDFIINIFDAVGLGIFSILGVKIALSSGYSYSLIYCAFIGMLTGVGGGMLRDIMLMEVPYVLRKRVYAVASILGSVVYYLLYSFRVNDFIAISCGCIIIVAIRILAGHYNWNLPKI
ncbi:MAG: TRIC cation channel family protein [Oscillospiraceae bacterium]